MLIAQAQTVVFLVMAGIFLVLALIFLITLARVFGPWLQAFLAGVHVSLLQIVGMRLRRTDVGAVVRALIMATQAGTPVASREMESAYLQGVDIEKVALAFIDTQKRGKKISFQDLVDAELHQRLEEKLKG